MFPEPQRAELARHFVQRTRADIKRDWEGEPCFPDREPVDRTYRLSPEYKALFAKTYAFCSEMVQSSEVLGKRQQRVRYWAALALLRCVMSSPAAAVAALENRRTALQQDDPDYKPFIYESGEDQTDDEQPTPPIEDAQAALGDYDRRRLRDLGRLARALHHAQGDTKFAECATLVATLIRQRFSPIIWCRYIATADYLAEGLRQALEHDFPTLQFISITSATGDDDERRVKIEEVSVDRPRVLAATDCLSEGINLQEIFDAVIHYDLPWNPNRLEQREGRVDRFGKTGVVKAIRYFSPDSAVDGVVLDVLLNKVREIHRALGTYVPVPDESESVTEAVLQALFLRGKGRAQDDSPQLELDLDMPQVQELHRRWDRDVERERVNRSRFAQRAMKPAQVRDELEATDAVLGDPAAVRSFVLEAAQRLNLAIAPDRRNDVYRVQYR